MTKFLVVCALAFGVVLPVYADNTDAQPVSLAQFIEQFKGSYLIELVNGQPPKEDNNKGSVELEEDQGLLSFAFCQPTGVCDPGYNYLPPANTQINVDRVSPTEEHYTIAVTLNNKVTRYTWDSLDGKIVLKHFDYKMTNGEVITLEHVLRKLRD